MINKIFKQNRDKILYNKFLGFLVKKGSKIGAKRILDKTFSKISNKTRFSRRTSLTRLFSILNSFVEVKSVRVRRRFVLVPFSINLKRRSYLIVKWIMDAIKKKKKKKSSFSRKLGEEILSVLKGSFSRSKKSRDVNISKAMANRSNIHYRW
jgi:ribosomal protein S7